MKRFWLIFMLATLLIVTPGMVQAADPTPTPATQGNQAPTGSPILSILVLGIPFAFLIWKSRGKKNAPRVTSGACLPVVDEYSTPQSPPDKE